MSKLSIIMVCVFVALVSCDLTPELRLELFKVQNECMQISKATDEMMINALAGRFTDAPELAEQMVCVAKRGGILDDDGHFHKDELKSKMLMFIDDKAKVDAFVEKCLIERDTIQASALEAAKCVFTEMYL